MEQDVVDKSKCIIIDDVHYQMTSEERAKSKANAKRWFKDVLPKRISKDTPIMVIFSRLHNQDKRG